MNSTNQTPNRSPTADPSKASKRLQPGLNLDTSFGDLNCTPHVESSFGELFWRALLEGPRIYLILPVKTQN
jgi:hypothetical protein